MFDFLCDEEVAANVSSRRSIYSGPQHKYFLVCVIDLLNSLNSDAAGPDLDKSP